MATSNLDPFTHTTSDPRKLKILMLHGYTQTGPLFHAKTRALEKALHKAFPPALGPPSTTTDKSKPPPAGSLPLYPGGVHLIYPDGPRSLSASDIPGFNASGIESPDATTDSRAWWTRNDRTGQYDGLEEGLSTIADAIRESGGIDGVIGFSQGAAAAAIVASLLERGRPAAFAHSGGTRYPPAFLKSPVSTTETLNGADEAIQQSRDQNAEVVSLQSPLRFAVSYSGFATPNPLYSAFYTPNILTASLHFIGSLDTLVEESRCLALAESFVDPQVVYHPGGHFVPIGKEMVGALVGFIRNICGEKMASVEEVVRSPLRGAEDKVEDMDVPF